MLMETPSSPPPEHRSFLGLVLRLAALTLVAGLLALLVWRVVNAGQGGRLVNAVREHKKPVAPDFRLSVLWPHTETWPRSMRALLASGRIVAHKIGEISRAELEDGITQALGAGP